MVDQATSDRIIAVMKEFHGGYNNTDYSVKEPQALGRGHLYPVSFKGGDGIFRENYVYTVSNKTLAYKSIKDALRDSMSGIVPFWRDVDILKLYIVTFLTITFSVAVIWIVIRDPENKALQVLSGLLGLTIGYIVGKNDKGNTA